MKRQDRQRLTSFPEEFPASRFPWLESKKEKGTVVTYGLKCSGLSESLGRLGSSLKTYLASCGLPGKQFVRTWSARDILSPYLILKLRLSARGTGGNGSCLWATPNTMDHLPQRSQEALRRQAEGARKGRSLPANLREQVDPETMRAWKEPEIWRTPVAADAASRAFYHNSRGEPNLSGQARLWPTPTAQDHKRRGPNSRQQGLPEKVRETMYPTPTTGAGPCGGTGSHNQLKKLAKEGLITEEERRSASQGNGGQLNPDWVEWLMGFPIGWTEV